MTQVLWFAGWACHWSPDFQAKIEALTPHLDHQWLGYELYTSPDFCLEDHLHAEQNFHLVAWSLGALKSLDDVLDKPLLQKMVFYGPAWDFCAENLGWKVPVLRRMIKVLRRDREAVLLDFYQKVGLEESEAKQQAQIMRSLDIEILVEGLEDLQSKLSENCVLKLQDLASQICIYQGVEDQLVSSELTRTLSKEWDFANLTFIPEANHNIMTASIPWKDLFDEPNSKEL